VIWPIVVFQAVYDEIELQKNQLWCHVSDVIPITSPKRHKIFRFAPPSQSKFLATPVPETLSFWRKWFLYSSGQL